MYNTIVLLARMRSGTTALRAVLATNPQILQLGEIFHSEYLDDERFFYNYFIKRISESPALALPSGDNRRALFKEYLTDVRKRLRCDNQALVIGINYNSLHALSTYWQNSLSPPYLLDLVRLWDFGVIHLIRENLLQTFVSERRARATGIWHIKAEEERASVAVEVDLKTLLPELEDREAEIALVKKWVADYHNLLQLTYEDTFEPDNTINQTVLKRCADFLGVPNRFVTGVPLRRTAQATLREEISNYEAVVDVLSNTRFSRFLDC